MVCKQWKNFANNIFIIGHFFDKKYYIDNVVNGKIYNNEYIVNYYSISNYDAIFKTCIGKIHFINSRRTMWFPYFSFTASAIIKDGDEYIHPFIMDRVDDQCYIKNIHNISNTVESYIVNLYGKKLMRRKTLWNSFLEYYGTFTLSSLLFCFSCYMVKKSLKF